jgi:hypothetical protein
MHVCVCVCMYMQTCTHTHTHTHTHTTHTHATHAHTLAHTLAHTHTRAHTQMNPSIQYLSFHIFPRMKSKSSEGFGRFASETSRLHQSCSLCMYVLYVCIYVMYIRMNTCIPFWLHENCMHMHTHQRTNICTYTHTHSCTDCIQSEATKSRPDNRLRKWRRPRKDEVILRQAVARIWRRRIRRSLWANAWLSCGLCCAWRCSEQQHQGNSQQPSDVCACFRR